MMLALVILALFVAFCLLGAAFIVHEEKQIHANVQPMPPYAAKYFERVCSESELAELEKAKWQE